MNGKQIDFVSLFAVSFAVFLGGVARFFPLFFTDFPLNDGGLFFRMTQDILDHNFSLPLYTSYNVDKIPFAYPPAAFYLMALLQRFFHLGLIDQLHFLPALISALTIPAFYFLSRSMTGSKERSFFAVFAYALMPHSYFWLIMGGGITRSLGLLFGILAILSVWEMFKKPRTSILFAVIIFCSLTILSHPETAWFVFLTSLLIGLRYGVNKKGILFAMLTIIGILFLTSPWWWILIQRFGVSTFLDAANSGDLFSFLIVLFYFTGEPFVTILAVLILLGIFAEVARKKFFLSVWLVIIFLFSARSGHTFATIPGSMLVGSGIVWVLVPGLLSFARRIPMDAQSLGVIFNERILKLALGILLIYAFFSAILASFMRDTEIPKLSKYDHQAMEWISQNTPLGSRFAVLTGAEVWAFDPTAEWFPALTRRISVSTVQGSEWLPEQQYVKQIKRNDLLQNCVKEDMSCIMTWAKNANDSFSHLYIVKPEGVRLPIYYSLTTSNNIHVIFDNPGVSIFEMDDSP